MEAHHPHQHIHHEKKWKEYLLEFIMIFLAVSLSFFAESLREKITESHNAKEYAGLLINDIEADLAEFNTTDHVLKRIINSGDSLSILVHEKGVKNIPSGKLYYYEYWSGWQWRVTPRNATLKQLESSGSLRYLGSKTLIRKILDYEETLKIVSLLEDNIAPEKRENWSLVQKVFDVKYFNVLQTISVARRDSASQTSEEGDQRLDSFLRGEYPLFTFDNKVWMELSNMALTSSNNYNTLLTTVNKARENAEDVIYSLKRRISQ